MAQWLWLCRTVRAASTLVSWDHLILVSTSHDPTEDGCSSCPHKDAKEASEMIPPCLDSDRYLLRRTTPSLERCGRRRH